MLLEHLLLHLQSQWRLRRGIEVDWFFWTGLIVNL
jgi:hypothetical protein